MRNEIKIPPEINNWLIEPVIPAISVGDILEINIGTTAEFNPMQIPF